MNLRKIAILADSGTDVPADFIKEHNIFIAPLKILYKDAEYNDRVDITPQEVYQRLEVEIPKTSLPSPDWVMNLFQQMEAQGYEEVLAVTISSGLSGTHNALRLMAQDYPKLKFHFIDTKNIGIGAGMQVMLAAELVQQGLASEAIVPLLEESAKKSKVFFVLDTLEYLSKGGRIGKVSAILGSLLKLRPVISCNLDGIYDTVAKVRGSANALAKTISIAAEEAGKHARFAVAVAHGSAVEQAAKVMAELKSLLPRCERFISTDISPALGVHTGPGIIGIAVQWLPA